jgi:hypothetical protein
VSEHDADAPVSASESCSKRVERCNARDDDCDGIIDEQSDSSCNLAHAASSCVRGTCVIDRCSQNYYNCNQLTSDGCESKVACGACSDDCEPALPAESMAPSAPDLPDASTPVTTGQAPQTVQPSAPTMPSDDDADGGQALTSPTPDPDSDAGASCAGERCAGQEDGCEGLATCACEAAAPTGQGAQCDRCLCAACPEALTACTGTEDEEWNALCGAVLTCFGKSVRAGLCVDSDCFQNGDGPCAAEYRSAFALGWVCSDDPVRAPCGAVTQVRLDCYQNRCAAFCKF